jgi:hypothetical protein
MLPLKSGTVVIERDTYLSVAFMGGPVFSQFDPSSLIFGDQYQNGSYNPSNPTSQLIKVSGYSYWDLSTGVSFSSELNNHGKFYVGGALSHFAQLAIKSTIGDDKTFLPRKWTLNIGSNTPVADQAKIIAFADYFAQNGSRQFLGGLLYGMDVVEYYDEAEPVTFYVGSFLRAGDALIPVVKMDFNHMSLGVSYDINISKLRVVSDLQGELELTASHKGFLKIRNSTLDKVRCVKF